MVTYFILISNIISWFLFSVLDFIEETMDKDCFFQAFFIIPILTGVSYLLLEKQLKAKQTNALKYYLTTFVKWVVIGIAFFIPISSAISENVWFIKQASGGWEHILNGAEYLVFGVFFMIIVPLIVIVWNLFKWIYSKIRK